MKKIVFLLTYTFVFLDRWVTEYVYDTELRRAINLDKEISSAKGAATKANPDDDLF